MSDYSKTYDGAAKDAAASTITGADFDTEFSAISTAVATKANKKVPATTNNVSTLSSTGDLQDSGMGITSHTASKAAQFDASGDLQASSVTTTELSYLSGATSNIQTQLNNIPSRTGALVYRGTTSPYLFNSTSLVAVDWDAEKYDDNSIHDTVTNPSRLTVPSGVSKVKVTANIAADTSTSEYAVIYVTQNGGSAVTGCPKLIAHGVSTTAGAYDYWIGNLAGAVINVSPGDYFEVKIATDGNAFYLDYVQSWFAMEIIE